MKPVISCEHAGNDVPAEYGHIFRDGEEVLNTHRGLDLGSLELAQYLADRLKAPLHYTTVTRLLVECNRSTGNSDFFSKYSNKLPESDRADIIREYYYPYRKKVEAEIASLAAKGQVLHLSSHSFTPELHGKIRNADIGLLYDPSRSQEADFCRRLQDEIERRDRSLRIRHNYPYKGTDDGFTTSLRKVYPENKYLGIEIEVNQRFPVEGGQGWERVKEVLGKAVEKAGGG